MSFIRYIGDSRDVDEHMWSQITLRAEEYARESLAAARIAVAQMLELGPRVCAAIEMESMEMGR